MNPRGLWDYLAIMVLSLLLWLCIMFVLACVKVVRDAAPGSCAKSDTHLFLYCRETPAIVDRGQKEESAGQQK